MNSFLVAILVAIALLMMFVLVRIYRICEFFKNIILTKSMAKDHQKYQDLVDTNSTISKYDIYKIEKTIQ